MSETVTVKGVDIMMEVIEDLPDDTVDIASRGRITKDDYVHVLIPAIEKKLETHEKVKILYYVSDMEEGVEMAALWQDTTFGLRHWSHFSHLAIVTDIEWVKSTIAFFAWMIPAEVKLFSPDQDAAARAWLVLEHGE